MARGSWLMAHERSDLIRLFLLSSLQSALNKNSGFFFQNFSCSGGLFLGKNAAREDLGERLNAKTVHGRELAGALVRMAAIFDEVRFFDQADRMFCSDPEPQVIILAHRKRFVKKSDFVEELPAHHHG
ncbi:MAG: hypothetical protein V1673_06235 [Candidatus Omnitrophota bacterium]